MMLALISIEINAQGSKKTDVTGVVLDSQGKPVVGAVVFSTSDKVSVATTESGEFTILATDNALLQVSALGYQIKTVVANPQLKTVTLTPEAELVNVLFNKVDKNDILGGVSYLNVSELMEKNDMNSSGVNIAALLPGLNGNIWGSNNLVLVDGIPRDLGNLNASEIEQITVLKGAAAVALYGSIGAKGILLITTKRGTSESNSFKLRANTGIFVPKTYPKYLGSAEYMTLYNEARVNDGLAAKYSPEEIYNYASGENPYRYPDVDYYSSDYLKKFSRRTDAAAEFRGGNERARFYANIGFYNSNSLLNVGKGKNESISRFNVRGNLDIKINDFISSKINTSMAFYNTSFAKGNYWSQASTLLPNRYAPLIPISYLEQTDVNSWNQVNADPFLIDGKYLLGGSLLQPTNPFADLYTQGHEKYTSRQYQFDASLNFNLASVVKGLSFDTQFGVDYYSRYYLNEDINSYAVYDVTWNDYAGYDQISSLNKINENKATRGRTLDRNYQYQKTFVTGKFNYKNTFGNVHNVTGLLLASAYQQTISETYHRLSNANLGFQASYNYGQKYYADFTGNLVHSSRLAPGHREAISPTFSLGWRISKEKFMSDVKFIDDLKLTGSIGTLNTDIDLNNYFMYKAVFMNRTVTSGVDGGANFQWNELRLIQGTDIRRWGNDNLDFVKRKEINLGLEATLFNKLLRVSGSYFRTKMEGMPIQKVNSAPNFFVYGANTNLLPYENYDNNLYSGFDFSVTANKKVDKVDLTLGVVGTYSTGKATKRSENFAFDYLTRVGKPVDAIWGLVSNGLFMSQSEINDPATPTQYGTLKPGDIKYVDQNNDGKIDGKDAIYLGRSSAPFIYGINLTAKWRSFTVFALLNGQLGGYGLKSNDYYKVRGDRKYSEVVRGRTTIGTNENGEMVVTKLGNFPRLTTLGNDNNFQDSDYWMYKTDFIRLGQVQLSYEIPYHLYQGSFIKNMGVYINGADLLTIAKERKVLETNIGSSPQSRFFNVGVKATF